MRRKKTKKAVSVKHAAYNNFDPLGSYTGNNTVNEDFRSRPVQDADDL